MTFHINMEILTSRIQGYLKDDVVYLHSPRSFSNHVTYRLDSSGHGDLLLRVAWAAIWEDKNRQVKEVSDFKMRSEVATMHYVKQHTTIPVADILVYDPDWDRKVGGECMLMKYIDGISPASLTDDQWEALCTSVADIWSRLLRLRFKSIGSIYEQQDGSESRYFIGPMTYIPDTGSIASPEATTSGPFSSTREWLVAAAMGKLNATRRLPSDFDYEQARKWQGTVIDVVQNSPLLDSSNTLDHEQIVLGHVDYSLHNILVDREDPTRIVAVADWEGARTVPMWAANPVFRWPLFLPESKVAHLRQLMRDRICGQIPGWEFTIGDGGNDLRYLEMQTSLSSEDPSWYDNGQPVMHRMSWLTQRSMVY
ncbi:hypothetical protein IW261DRAFT_1612156 [Armillaria novae-zelandiae]|uniref:Aminoglycoside phosphotransferase domain-containing protein n=1 Tax=Armillaria novae-zelandiae TaxID=153914 RepID=A0AA39U5T5_9AGAR|nr:hypothetical protein IW261DRAFT_1612156 [Armillaria novae-zelandiae]